MLEESFDPVSGRFSNNSQKCTPADEKVFDFGL
jgi:hypothetical protein